MARFKRLVPKNVYNNEKEINETATTSLTAFSLDRHWIVIILCDLCTYLKLTEFSNWCKEAETKRYFQQSEKYSKLTC